MEPWCGHCNIVYALAASDTLVYAGGSFTNIGGSARNRIAAIDTSSGAATNWNPNANNPVTTLAVDGGTVYVGGSFTNIGGQTRYRIAALDAANGAVKAWNPVASDQVNALAVNGNTVYAGGVFNSVGGQDRNNIAALDVATGALTAWNPNATIISGTANVAALAVSGSKVYVGGLFSSIGGDARSNIAAIDASTGTATAFKPNANGQIYSLAVNGNIVYAGGSFGIIGGASRSQIAALDADTGLATAWKPSIAVEIYNAVVTFRVSGDTVYVGGRFGGVGGQPRSCLAAINAATAQVTAWNPNPTPCSSFFGNSPQTLQVNDGKVYAGGTFNSVGTLTRNGIAAIDAVSGLATSWNPNANNSVLGLAMSGTTMYVGGAFTSIGGQARNRLAALDTTKDTATAWNPDVNGAVSTVAMMSDTAVYAGGKFTSVGGSPYTYLARFDFVKSSNADLSSLTTNTGALVPTFASSSANYTVEVPYDITSLTVTPTFAEPNAHATIAFNDGTANPATSGQASSPFALNIGVNKIAIMVTAEDGVTKKTYTVLATRAKALTNTGITSSLNPSTYGQAVTFNVTVTGNGPNPTGRVYFKDKGVAMFECGTDGSVGLVNGIAACTTSVLNVVGSPHAITAEYSGDSDNNPSSGSVLNGQIVNKANQIINFSAAPTIIFGGTGSVSATGGESGNPVVFSSITPTICSTSGTNGSIVTSLTAGQCTIAANQAGDANYNAATQTQTFAINKANQSISFGSAPSVIVDGNGTVSATGGASGNPVTFSSTTPGICTVSGSTVTGVAVGSCIIVANQLGNTNYNSAPQVTQSITVGKGNQTINFSAAPTVTVDGTGTLSATGGKSSNAVTFSSTTTGICTVSGNTVTGVAVGSCIIAANQLGNTNYNDALPVTQTITVGKGNQAIAFGAAPTVTVGSTGALSATGGKSSNAVTFSSTTPAVCTTSGTNGSTVTGLSAGICTVTAYQSGNANYNDAETASLTFSITNIMWSLATECLLNWAENSYPDLLAPAGSPTAVWNTYNYRHYSVSDSYVGVSTVNNHVYYMGPDGNLQDVGSLSDWLPKAGCQVPPPPPPATECLFNWAERTYSDLFAPSGTSTAIAGDDFYRYYSTTNSYLRLSSVNNHVIYQGSDGVFKDVGPITDWLPLAGCL